jgi:dihydroxyacetone kinase-like protein
MELYIVYGELEQILRGLHIRVARRLVGNYITSLEMAGCSITLLKADDEMLSLWDDPVLTPGLRWGI